MSRNRDREPKSDDLIEPSVDTVTSGTLVDYVSRARVRATPEELGATQPFSRSLVEDYQYPVDHLQTRPQHRVKARPSDNSRSYPVDIAVFQDSAKRDEDLYIIVEAKKPTRTDGEHQLRDYMRFSAAALGVWTNGDERSFWLKRDTATGVEFLQIPNLPRYGESLESIGKYRKRDLVVPTDLKSVFRSMRNHLAANVEGTSRDEVLAVQLINLVFCKIYDERFTGDGGLLEFRSEPLEAPDAVHARITSLFNKVKAKYSEVFDDDDKLSLDENSLAYAVGELQGYSLMDSTRDAVGEAFETFLGATLKGAQGQFFTPRNIIATIVALVNPGRDDLVIDPACGAAGFLVETLRRKWSEVDAQGASLGWSATALAEERQSVAIKSIFGIEKDELLGKVAKAYMAIIGDGKGGIFFADSLDKPTNWKPTMQSQVSLGKFDVVLANPPFGKDIKVTGAEKLAQFELAHSWKKDPRTGVYEMSADLKKRQNPQTLFIERCLQLLRVGGTLGIILPESFFHAPNARSVLQFMTSHNVKAVFDLPHNTFRPFNNAKCVAVVLEKGRKQQPSILMAVAEQMGHDHIGRPLFRWDEASQSVTAEVWDDTARIRGELASGVRERYTFEINADEVRERGIYIPRYYWPEKNVHAKLAADPNVDVVSLGELVKSGAISVTPGHGSPEAKFKGRGTHPYIRVKDIINWEIYKDPTARIPTAVFGALTKARPLQVHDVVMVSRGSYRIGDVAMVGPSDLDVALTRELLIIRGLGFNPFYLLYLLSRPEVRAQINNRVFIDTTLPNLGDRWTEIELPVDRRLEERERIVKRVMGALQQRWDSMGTIRDLRAEVGAVTDDLALELDASLLGEEE